MNLHDSEKVENLLHHAGWRPTAALDDADLLLINTCSIRAKAEHRLGSLGSEAATGIRRHEDEAKLGKRTRGEPLQPDMADEVFSTAPGAAA